MNLSEIGFEVLCALSPLLLTLLTYGAARLNAWLNLRIKSEAVADALGRLNQTVLDAVKELDQLLVEEYKKRATDGKLTKGEVDELRDLAIENVKSYIGMKGVAELLKILGLTPKELDSRIGGRVDATVYELRRR
jgi:hypothetical protein